MYIVLSDVPGHSTSSASPCVCHAMCRFQLVDPKDFTTVCGGKDRHYYGEHGVLMCIRVDKSVLLSVCCVVVEIIVRFEGQGAPDVIPSPSPPPAQ